MSDRSNGPLWPSQVRDAVGRENTAESLAAQAGVTVDEFVAVLQNLEAQGFAKLVFAPVCPQCDIALAHYDDPDEVDEEAELSCRLCGERYLVEDLEARLVYVLLRSPDE